MLSVAPDGFEEVELADGIELAVYTDEAGQAAIRELFANAAATRVEPGWEERWRSFHRPVRVGGVWIGPPWETPLPRESALVVDPGRAFGTGAHATTRACIELLAAEEERRAVLDAGCGSGVVALAAARLGFSPVIAVDLDPVAVEAARENARRNAVAVEARLLDVLSDELPRADLVVANIELAAIEALLARLEAPRVITSGYLAGELPAHPGWNLRETLELDGWAAHVLTAL